MKTINLTLFLSLLYSGLISQSLETPCSHDLILQEMSAGHPNISQERIQKNNCKQSSNILEISPTRKIRVSLQSQSSCMFSIGVMVVKSLRNKPNPDYKY